MRSKKTVHAIVKYFYPVAAGIETNMLETYSVLAEKNWNVVIHTSTNTLTEINILKRKEQLRNLSIKRYLWKWYGFWPSISWGGADIVALHNFNIVPHAFLMAYVGIRRLFHLPTPKLILIPHGGFTPDWEIFSPITKLFKKIYHYTVGTVLINSTVNSVRAVSEWERHEIIKHGVRKSNVITIPNGIEDEGYIEKDSIVNNKLIKDVASWKPYIIQIGRIYTIKNYETTIKALAALPQHIHYVIAGPIGDYYYLEKLKRMIASLRLTNRVHFVGVVRGDDKFYLIRNSEMMVHMARWESFCNVVHEAMSQGKVVIVANNTALKYLVKDAVNGYLVDTNDSKTLADKIKYVMNTSNKKEMDVIQKNNIEYTKHHTWRSVAESLNNWMNKYEKNK